MSGNENIFSNGDGHPDQQTARRANQQAGLPFLEDLRHLPKSAKHALAIEFSGLEIGRAAESYRPRMAKDLPKPLRTLYRCGGAWAVNGFTSSNAAVHEIERQSHEASYLGHMLAVDLEQ